MMLIAVRLLTFAQRSSPSQKGNWENWGIGVLVLIGVVAVMYWLTSTKPAWWRRKGRDKPSQD